ncbi:hypothetical protein [Bradyrhizobium sp. Leo121]|uniref:hypothetical protein n=1 Tax=Bradyrhizobium sp. Leo121 TaxID=1571195 RepID=UPI001028B498|nr:hypothetical protein [Bradyrhizobium sp. Leo121]RZN36455.1 hypothetical protein CWO90_00545 [Bradyrhizobium sp. Leo121]
MSSHGNFEVAGPGLLLVSAGRNITEDQGSITSIGPLVVDDARPGASILLCRRHHDVRRLGGAA